MISLSHHSSHLFTLFLQTFAVNFSTVCNDLILVVHKFAELAAAKCDVAQSRMINMLTDVRVKFDSVDFGNS